MLSATFISLALLMQSVSGENSWGGASLRVTPGTMKAVSGSFMVPHVSPPDNWVAGTQYAASTWVGIDGIDYSPKGPNCSNMLQSGISMRVTPDTHGTLSYECCPWYEWLPAGEKLFDQTCTWCQPGDSISVNVVATSTTTGNATIVNHTNNKNFSISLSSPSAPLCLEFADWVVEQDLGHIAAFDAITIKPTATVNSGATVLPTGTAASPWAIAFSSTTYATSFATSTAVVVTDEAWYAV